MMDAFLTFLHVPPAAVTDSRFIVDLRAEFTERRFESAEVHEVLVLALRSDKAGQ